MPVTVDELLMLAARRAPRPAGRRCWSATCRSAPTRRPTSRRSRTAHRFVKEAGCDAVKLEGGGAMAERARGDRARRHAGDGPRRPHAADRDRARRLPRPGPHGRARRARVLEDALALQEAGCFAIVFEAIPAEVTDVIMEHMEIPVIGIGAGAQHRRPGARAARPARHPRRPQAEVRQALRRRARPRWCAACAAYAEDVRTRALPGARAHLRIAPEELDRLRAQLPPHRTRGLITTRSQPLHNWRLVGQAALHWPPWRGCPSCSRRKEREFFDLFEEAGANIVRAAELLERMLEHWPDDAELAREIVRLRAGGRPHHARHHPAAELDVRDADRPRGHLRARLGARRHRRLHRGGRRTSSALYRIEAPMDQATEMAPDPAPGRARRSPARSRGCARFKDIHHYTVEINRLENDGDRVVREALASLFERGIDPMLVIRWKDIFERLEDAIDADRDGREHPRGHRHQEPVDGMGDDVVLWIVVGDRARVRLHQRLPRHRQRGRDVDLHARDGAARGGRARRDAELRRRVPVARGRGDDRHRASSTPTSSRRRSSSPA